VLDDGVALVGGERVPRLGSVQGDPGDAALDVVQQVARLPGNR